MKKDDRRISIVLNGKEKSYSELKKDKEHYEELLNQEITATKEEDFPWLLSETEQKDPTSPKVVDLGERRRDKEKLAAPFWDDGRSEESPKIPLVKRKKKRVLNFKQLPLGLLGIVLSAIIVGVSFGFMMLTIFTGDTTETVSVTDVVQAPTPEFNEAAVVSGGNVPTLAVEVIQGGAFSLVAKGRETAQALKDRGFAATLTNTADPVYLFIGIGLDRQQATVIANKYKENGQEVYVKPYAVSSTGSVGNQDQVVFLQKNVEMFEQLALLVANGFASGGSLLTNETLAELKMKYNELLTLADPFLENELQAALALAFQGSIANAYQNIENYASSKDQAKLWQVQQNLLNGLISYEELSKTF